MKEDHFKLSYSDTKIYAQCVRVVYLHRIPSLVSVLITSFIPLFVGFESEMRKGTFFLVTVLWLYVIGNYLLARYFNAHDFSDDQVRPYGTFFYIQHLFLGFFLNVIFFYLYYSGVEEALLYLLIASLGFSGGSVSAFHQMKWAPPIFVFSSLSPQIVFSFSHDIEQNNVVAIMLIIILIFMTIISLEQHKNWIRTLALSFELDKAKQKAENSARIDSLTKLYNRRAFYELAPKYLSNAQRQNRAIAFVMLDIDHFKHVNDTYGHGIGDKVLEKVSEILRSRLREADLVSRLGGEEFALILPETDKDDAIVMVERIRTSIESLKFEEKELKITSSFGIALCKRCTETLDKLLIQADSALYQAKQEGRNRTILLQD